MKNNKNILKQLTGAPFFGAIIISIVMIAIMLFIKPTYLSATNIYTIAKVMTVTALAAFSQMVIISVGGMNIAVGSIGALAAIMCGWFMSNHGWPWGACVVLGIVTGLVLGLINGLLIYRSGGVGVAFFLTTLATDSIFTGLVLTITQGNPFYGPNRVWPKAFLAFGNTKILGLPLSFFYMIIIGILLYIMYNKTKIGRQMLAFGANYKAAELYGVSKLKISIVSNLIAGFISAWAGLLAMIRIEAAQPSMGADWMLQSFAAPLIGGTRNEGGKISVFGAILGALVLTVISNALVYLRVDVYWNDLVNGVIILLAVTLDKLRYIKK